MDLDVGCDVVILFRKEDGMNVYLFFIYRFIYRDNILGFFIWNMII